VGFQALGFGAIFTMFAMRLCFLGNVPMSVGHMVHCVSCKHLDILLLAFEALGG
jgi:hypothetical protein